MKKSQKPSAHKQRSRLLHRWRELVKAVEELSADVARTPGAFHRAERLLARLQLDEVSAFMDGVKPPRRRRP